METQSLLNRLVAWASEELAAQRRLLELLESQENAVRTHDLSAVDSVSSALQECVGGAPCRAGRRREILEGFSRMWAVPVSALTLSSIAERCGSQAEVLCELRSELRDVVALVLKRNRRLGALLGAHRRIAREVIEILLIDERGNPLHDQGTLIDAQV